MPRGGKREGAGRKKTVGAPTDYRPEFVREASKLCALGATDLEVADFFEINRATLYRWKARYPEFCDALKAGKAQADERVERSLYHRAVGYSFDSEKVFQFQGTVVRTPTREHVPPDTTAAIFWLKNRRPDEWREKSEIHHKVDASALSDDELSRIATGRSEGVAPAPRGPAISH